MKKSEIRGVEKEFQEKQKEKLENKVVYLIYLYSMNTLLIVPFSFQTKYQVWHMLSTRHAVTGCYMQYAID